MARENRSSNQKKSGKTTKKANSSGTSKPTSSRPTKAKITESNSNNKNKTQTNRKKDSNSPEASQKKAAKRKTVASEEKTSVTKKQSSNKGKAEKSPGKVVKAEGPTEVLKLGSTTVILLGVAHVSQSSVDDVKRLVGREKPDVIAVELCNSRYQAFSDPEAWRKLDFVQVIRERKIYLLMSSIVLSIFQKKIGEKAGVKPGAEMLEACNQAETTKSQLWLIDRDIQTTLKRAWQSVGYFVKSALFTELLFGLFHPGAAEEEIEEMKNRDVLEELLQNLPPRYAHVRKILLTERDMYMAQKIEQAVFDAQKKPKKVLAVLGAGHLKGTKNYLEGQGEPERRPLEELDHVDKKPAWVAWAKFIVPIVIIVGLFVYLSDPTDLNALYEDIGTWIVVKASLCGIVSLALMAHPLAILAATLTGPISNFNPVLKPGWTAALVEAKFRQPQVGDFENMAADVSTFKGVYTNRVMRIFSLFILPQLASSLATGIALYLIAQ